MKNILFGFLVLLSCSLSAQKDKKAALMLKEGPDGVYVLLGNQRISKADAMNDHFIGAIISKAGIITVKNFLLCRSSIS